MVVFNSYLSRYAVRFIVLCSIVIGVLAGTCLPARAAFPIRQSTQIVKEDSANATKPKVYTAPQLRHLRVLSAVCSSFAIGCLVVAIAGATTFFVPWLLLATAAAVCIPDLFEKKRKYTYADVMLMIAFLPAIVGVAIIMSALLLIFGLPRMIAARRGRRKRNK